MEFDVVSFSTGIQLRDSGGERYLDRIRRMLLTAVFFFLYLSGALFMCATYQGGIAIDDMHEFATGHGQEEPKHQP